MPTTSARTGPTTGQRSLRFFFAEPQPPAPSDAETPKKPAAPQLATIFLPSEQAVSCFAFPVSEEASCCNAFRPKRSKQRQATVQKRQCTYCRHLTLLYEAKRTIGVRSHYMFSRRLESLRAARQNKRLEQKGEMKVTDTTSRPSAKIYQFPLRARTAREDAKIAADMSRVATTACGSSWYHDAAIQEDKRTDR